MKNRTFCFTMSALIWLMVVFLTMFTAPSYSDPTPSHSDTTFKAGNLVARETVSGVTISGTTVLGVTISGTTFVGLPAFAPVSAQYWVNEANGTLTNEFDVSNLLSGVTDAMGILGLFRYGTYYTPIFKNLINIPTGLIKLENDGILSIDIVASVPGTDYIFSSGVTPASSDASGVTGQVESDEDYFYYYIGTEWKRIAFSGVTW